MPMNRQYVSRLVSQNPKVLTVALIAVAIVQCATVGYDGSMMNGLNILPQYKDYFQLNSTTTGFLTASSWLGSVLCCPFVQPCTDYLGRKLTILSAACLCIFGCVIQTAAQNFGMFSAGRVLVGLGGSIGSAAAPALIAELVAARRRGAILGFFYTSYYVGSLLSSLVNYFAVNISSTWAWRLPSALMAVPSLLSIFALLFVPESPRWLIAHDKPEYAHEVLTISLGKDDLHDPEVLQQLNEITAVIRKEKEEFSNVNPFRELFSTKPNLHRLFILIVWGAMTETLGNFVISYYLGDILNLAGVTSAKTQLQINVILSCWCFTVAVCGSWLLDVIGRRPQTIMGLCGMIISLVIVGALTKVYGQSTNDSAIYAIIAFVFIFQGVYSSTITPMCVTYPTEILPYRIRPAGMSFYIFADTGSGLAYSFLMSIAMKNIGWKFYFINAGYDVIYLLIVYFCFPETARIPLEEVALKFGDLTEQNMAEFTIQRVADSYSDMNAVEDKSVIKLAIKDA